jgi:hypothetical protein
MKRKIDFKYHTMHLIDHGVTIGYIPTETPDGLEVRVAAAWTNPKDQYVKARGREIVAGRLAANRNHVFTLKVKGKQPTIASEYRDLEARIADETMNHMPKAIIDAVDRQEKRALRQITHMF